MFIATKESLSIISFLIRNGININLATFQEVGWFWICYCETKIKEPKFWSLWNRLSMCIETGTETDAYDVFSKVASTLPSENDYQNAVKRCFFLDFVSNNLTKVQEYQMLKSRATIQFLTRYKRHYAKILTKRVLLLHTDETFPRWSVALSRSARCYSAD